MDSTKLWMHSVLRKFGLRVSRVSPYTDDTLALAAMLQHAQVDLILDVGANIGQYGMERITTGFTGRIVSFEPLSIARVTLLRNAAQHPKWTVAEQCALGEHEGTVTMQVAENSQASSVLSATPAHLRYAPRAVTIGTEVVSLRRLDRVVHSFIQESHTPYLKIDVQGFEDQVLSGSSGIISRLIGLQVELSLIPVYGSQKLFPEMFSMITDMGFTLCRLIPVWIDKETGRWLQADGIFFRTGLFHS